ncbi:hypothetical protein V8F20_008451 [Naviculisporaceae sp. PSN 640]
MDPTDVDLSGGPVLLSLSLATVFFALATTLVRFFIRAGISKHIGVDDYTSGVASVVALVGTVFCIIEATAADPARAMEFDVLGKPWYLMSDTLSKISICLLFIILLKGTRQWRILLSVLIFLMAAVNFSFALTVNLQCRPLEKLWNPSVDGVCWDPKVQRDFGYFQGAFSVFTWFFLAFFGLVTIRDVTREGNPAWPYYSSAALSFACGIFSIVRTAKTAQIQDLSIYTSNSFGASLMSNLEQNFGLMAANVLTLGPLFSARAAKLSVLSSRSSRSRSRGKGPSRAGSTRPFTRVNSRASSHRTLTRIHSRSGSVNSSEVDLKRTTHLIIQGPRRSSMEATPQGSSNGGGRSFLRSANPSEPDEEYDLGDGRRGSIIEMPDLEAWPRGIIKTVSVEVVEEVNPDHIPNASAVTNNSSSIIKEIAVDGAADNQRRNSNGSAMEQDWETMLRAGPPAR